jgi:hypothetical protein
MRRNDKPGELSIRIGFARSYGTGADANKVHPSIEVTDETSGLHLELQLTAEQFTELLSGSQTHVSADKVSGFQGIGNWGKYLHLMSQKVSIQSGDYSAVDPRELPHVAEAIKSIEDAGYRCDSPRRNNGGQWVLTGRRYDAKP